MTVSNGGSGYSTATGVSTINVGAVASVSIENAGTGYSVGTYGVTGGSGSGLQIEVTSVDGDGKVTNAIVGSDSGSDYANNQTVTIVDGTPETRTTPSAPGLAVGRVESSAGSGAGID
eukprot:COSAG05_NODE_24_length_31553_cov_12.138647_25_plen_118_part_00